MKVTDRRPWGEKHAYTLTPWAEPHPKGGEAFHVDHAGRRLGDVRRFERDEVTARIGSSSASFTKRRVTYWTAYVPRPDPPGGWSRVCTFASRAGALRYLRNP